jgi:hypothetical protein
VIRSNFPSRGIVPSPSGRIGSFAATDHSRGEVALGLAHQLLLSVHTHTCQGLDLFVKHRRHSRATHALRIRKIGFDDVDSGHGQSCAILPPCSLLLLALLAPRPKPWMMHGDEMFVSRSDKPPSETFLVN